MDAFWRGLAELFANLTPAQADVISSAATLFSALIVAIVAPLTFHLLTRGGVKGFNDAVGDLKVAAESARNQSETIRSSMGTITKVSSGVTELGVLIASVQEALANTQNTLLESQPQPASNGQEKPDSAREQIKQLWRGLQEEVERQASAPHINGNTRAKYARMDRRGYIKLIEAMSSDGNLRGDLREWKEAYNFGMWAIHAGAEASPADLIKMQSLDAALRLSTGASAAPSATVAMPMTPRPNGGVSSVLRTPVPRSPRAPEQEPPSAAH